jgi:multiple sugar transport system substrate-binding protein
LLGIVSGYPRGEPMHTRRTTAVRRLSAALTAVSCLLLAACGSGAATVSAHRPVTITYWTWLGGMKQITAEFNATHSDVHVVLNTIPAGTSGGYSKMFTAVRAGNAPDAATVEYPELPAFATQGAIQDLTPYGGTALKSAYPAWTWGMVDQGGRVWGLPRDIAPMVLYYRKDLLAKYGITVPTTWAEYAADARKIRARNPKASIGAFAGSDSALIAGLAWQAGARWFSTPGNAWKVSTQDPSTDRVLNYWQPLISGHLVANESAYGQQWSADLQSGNLVTQIGGPWSAANIARIAPASAGKWAVAPLPQWPGAPGDGTNGGSTLVMLKGSKHPQQVMEFLKWVSTSADSIKVTEQNSPGAYPAALASVPIAKQEYDSTQTYYTGPSLFDVATGASATVGTGWQWGPDMAQSLSDLNDAMAGSMTRPAGGLRSALDSWERTTRADLRERGMNVAD